MAIRKIPTRMIIDGSVTTAKVADDAVTTAKVADTVNLGRRNLIFNGAMQVAQRGTSVSSLSSTATYSTCDRWQVQYGSSGTFTESQSSTSPDGFSNSLKLDCTTADASPDYLLIVQRMEGQNLQHLKKGTSAAESTTLSFYVRSSKTGTYQVNLRDSDNNRLIGATYTISSADTWEQKNITFAGDTTGTLGNDNSNSLQVEWWLASGSTYNSGAVPTSWEALSNGDRGAGLNVAIGASTDDEFYITGVQLEVGEIATPFEHLSYGEELSLCNRYYQEKYMFHDGASTYLRETIQFITTMRSAPTGTVFSQSPGGGGTNTSGKIYQSGGETSASVGNATTSSARLDSYGFYANQDAYGRVTLDAEL